ncbi:MAG: phosphopantetheine-binding protein [Phycisphaerales bacterium]
MKTSFEHSADIRSRVKSLLRVDLKLGDDYRVGDDDPLFGGEFDLDSLDALLLVSSVEKEFGIKIPNEAVGKSIFQSVSALADYIESQCDVTAAESISDSGEDCSAALERLPHGPGFRFLTRIESLTPGVEARGIWQLRGDEAFFADHFPARPLVPGVLIAEALAQLAGIVSAAKTSAQAALLVQVDLRFKHPVAPPVDLTLCSRCDHVLSGLHRHEVEAFVASTSVAHGFVTLSLNSESAEAARSANS